MERESLTPKTSVADLLNRCPQAIPIFLKHRMACVGCEMSGFETLEDAARIYSVPLAPFMNELADIMASCLDKSTE